MAHSHLYIRLMNSSKWRLLRNEWLTENPLCERCKQKGFIRSARCVHHMTPVESATTDRGCEDLAFSRGNLQALCYECHAEIHKAERSHSREAHKERSKERLERWKQRHTRATNRSDQDNIGSNDFI